MKIEELEKLCAKATPGPWWVEGLDVESSHVIVGEGEEWTQLYDTETGKPTKKVKQHKKRDQGDEGDFRVFSTSSILGDRPFEEALATAEFIAAARTYLPLLLKVARAAKAFTEVPTLEPWAEDAETAYQTMVEALESLEEP